LQSIVAVAKAEVATLYFGCLQAFGQRVDAVEPRSYTKTIRVLVLEENGAGKASLVQAVAENNERWPSREPGRCL